MAWSHRWCVALLGPHRQQAISSRVPSQSPRARFFCMYRVLPTSPLSANRSADVQADPLQYWAQAVSGRCFQADRDEFWGDRESISYRLCFDGSGGVYVTQRAGGSSFRVGNIAQYVGHGEFRIGGGDSCGGGAPRAGSLRAVCPAAAMGAGSYTLRAEEGPVCFYSFVLTLQEACLFPPRLRPPRTGPLRPPTLRGPRSRTTQSRSPSPSPPSLTHPRPRFRRTAPPPARRTPCTVASRPSSLQGRGAALFRTLQDRARANLAEESLTATADDAPFPQASRAAWATCCWRTCSPGATIRPPTGPPLASETPTTRPRPARRAQARRRPPAGPWSAPLGSSSGRG